MKNTSIDRPKVTKVTVKIRPVSNPKETEILVEADRNIDLQNFNYFPILRISDKLQYRISAARLFPAQVDNTVKYIVPGKAFDRPDPIPDKIGVEIIIRGEIDEADFEYLPL